MSKLTPAEVRAMSTGELVAAYNKLTGGNVKKFADRKTAEKRFLAAQEGPAEPKAAKVAKPKKEKAPKVDAPEKAPRPSFRDPVNLPAREGGATQYRPNSPKGQVIEAASGPDGVKMEKLEKLTGLDRQAIVGILRSINKIHGCQVMEYDVGICIDASGLTSRKMFSYDKAEQVVPPREGSKRSKMVEVLRKGTTLEKFVEKFDYTDRPERAEEALKLLHATHGYGLSEVDGVITIQE